MTHNIFMSDVTTEMPKYVCTKKVWALKIDVITINEVLGTASILPKEDGYGEIETPAGWLATYKGNGEDTGYYVIYKDGYKSWSPTKAFEEGYTLL